MAGRSKIKSTKKQRSTNGGIMNQLVSQEQMQQWTSPQVEAQDLVIPKILAMQGMSEAVTEGTAKFGEFRDSLSNRLIGSIEKPFEFIPVHCEKLWLVFDAGSKKSEFLRAEKMTKENENHDFESVNPETKKKEKWQRVYSFYVLLPEDIKNGGAMPHILSFKGTSYQAGKILFTQCYVINIQAGKTPASVVMKLTGSKQTNDLGTYVVMNAKPSRAATKEEVQEAFKWNQTIASRGVRVDDRDLKKTEKTVEEDTVPF